MTQKKREETKQAQGKAWESATAKEALAKARTTPPDAFTKAIEAALDNYFDEVWLEDKSPLAAPYFLGKAFKMLPVGLSRAQALKQLIDNVIDKAISELGKTADEENRVSGWTVLDLYYRDKSLAKIKSKHQRLEVDWAAEVGKKCHISRATVFRRCDVGVKQLADFISNQLPPPLVSERPAQRHCFGREKVIMDAFAALVKKQVVVLTGPSGIGKTSVGLALAERWGRGETLNLTIRPGLNDSLNSLAFSIGYFLRSLGAETTWRQIVADNGQIKNEAAIIGLIRHDLESFSRRPLLCLDEVGLLQEDSTPHWQILHFLGELRNHLPQLLMGHRMGVSLASEDNVHVLEGLPFSAMSEMLQAEGFKSSASTLTPKQEQSLWRMTHGVPALIRLFIALHRTGEPITECLRRIADNPSAEALLKRILDRADADERKLLYEMAIYEGFAPSDIWSADEEKQALDKLIGYGLVQQDLMGGMSIAPFIRGFILNRMDADAKATCHQKAGFARSARAEHTAAAWHYVRGGEHDLAVRVWAVHRVAEMAKGNARIAYALLRDVSLKSLSDPNDQMLYALLLAGFQVANGESQEALDQLGKIAWPEGSLMTLEMLGLKGDAHQLQYQIEQALAAYGAAIESVGKLLRAERSVLYRHRAYVLGHRMKDYKSARRDAAFARLEAENVTGNIEEDTGNFARAREHYEQAMKIASSLENNRALLHDCHSNLGCLSWRQNCLDESFTHLKEALAISNELLWTTAIFNDKMNLAAAHIIAKQYQQALEIAEEGLQQALPTGLSYYIAGLYTNAGEAHYYLGQLDKAAEYASQAIRLEEENHTPSAHIVMGMTQRAAGAYAAADQTLTLAIAIAGDYEDKYALAAAWRELGELRICQNRKNDAKNALIQSITLFREMYNEPQATEIEARLNTL